jgi:hypothetical protein
MLKNAGSEVKLDQDDKYLEMILEAMRNGKRLGNMFDCAEANYEEIFDPEEHEYKVKAAWSFETKRGKVTIDTGLGCVKLENEQGKTFKKIEDDMLEKLRFEAEIISSWEPEHQFTLREKLNDTLNNGRKFSYHTDSWDDLLEQDAERYGAAENWWDNTIDFRKVYTEDWEAGHGEYMSKCIRDVYAKTWTTSREDEPEIHVRKSYELRQFEAMQEKLKHEDPRKTTWVTKKTLPSWMPSYAVEEPKAKAGVTISYAW